MSELERRMQVRNADPLFVGRDWLVREVSEFVASSQGRKLLIVGQPGRGKSAFIAHLAETWACPTYFIRRGSTGGAVSSNARICFVSLGEQLYSMFGEDAFPLPEHGQTKVAVGLAGQQAEIVGRFIDELYTLPFLPDMSRTVSVKVGMATGGSTVIGERVRRLFDVSYALDPATLLHVAVLEPLRRLSMSLPEQKVVILVDALDEDKTGPAPHIGDLLVGAEDASLPQNLRLVMTSRPGGYPLNISRGAIVDLDDRQSTHWLHQQQDVDSYISQRLTELRERVPDLEPRSVQQYARRLATQSEGNFLYLYHVLNEVVAVAARGMFQLDEVPIPAGLDEVYRVFAVERIRRSSLANIRFTLTSPVRDDQADAFLELLRQADGIRLLYIRAHEGSLFAEDISSGTAALVKAGIATGVIPSIDVQSAGGNWEAAVLPIIGTLAVAFDALTREQIATFAGVDEVSVETVVDSLRPFLDEPVDRKGFRYCLYHSSFAEYLLDPSRNRDFRLSPQEYHAKIARSYRQGGIEWKNVKWDLTEDYPFEHLAVHLIEAGLSDELHELVATGDDENVWARAQFTRMGSYGLFTRDLNYAWEQAATAGLFDRVLLYALIVGSIRSERSGFTPELLAALIRYGHWTYTQALDTAGANATSLVRIIRLAGELNNSLPADVYRDAINAIRHHPLRTLQGRLLAQAVPYLPSELVADALELGNGLPEEPVENMRFGVDESVTSPRSEALAAIGVRLFSENRLNEVLALLPKLRGRYLGTLVTAIEPALSDAQVAQILELAEALPPISRAPLLGALAHTFEPARRSRVLEEALDLALSLERSGEFGGRAEGLASIAPYLEGEKLDRAVEAALVTLKLSAVTACARRMAETGRVHEALDACRSPRDYGFWWQVLPAVCDWLDSDEVESRIRQTFDYLHSPYPAMDDASFARFVHVVPPNLLDALVELRASLKFNDTLCVDEAMVDRLGRAGRWSDALQLARAARSEPPVDAKDHELRRFISTELLVATLPYLPSIERNAALEEAAAAASVGIDDTSEQASALVGLSSLLTGDAPLPQAVFKPVLERTLNGGSWQAERVLRLVSPQLTDPILLQIAATLARRLPIGRLEPERGIGPGRRVASPRIQALALLAAQNAPTHRRALIQEIVRMVEDADAETPGRKAMHRRLARDELRRWLPDLVVPELEPTDDEHAPARGSDNTPSVVPQQLKDPSEAFSSFKDALRRISSTHNRSGDRTTFLNAYIRSKDIHDERLRDAALEALAPFWELAAELASKSSLGVEVFWQLVPRVPDADLGKLARVAITIDHRGDFAQGRFRALLLDWARCRPELFESVWANLVRDRAEDGRPSLLRELPTLVAVRGAPETLATRAAAAVNLVTSWWR